MDFISINELRDILDQTQSAELLRGKSATLEYAEKSNPICIGTYDGELGCVAGFVIPTFMSDRAYIWFCTTEVVDAHKVSFARGVKRAKNIMQGIYPQIIGHCVENSSSVIWLKSLGAIFTETHNGLVKFIIEANNG